MFNLRRKRSASQGEASGRRTWTYRCTIDCADQVVRWATRHPEFKVRARGFDPRVVTVIGPADAKLPESDQRGVTYGWGVSAPWQNGLPVGYETTMPEDMKAKLLAQNQAVRANWGDA